MAASSALAPRLRHGGVSDTGRRRHNNEDRWYANDQRGIYLVIDGMGGEQAGEVAADIALRTVRQRLEQPGGHVEERLREAITLANDEILRQSQQRPEWHGMACVLTAALVEGDRVTIGHVGDSRLYLLQAGQLSKLTRDHSPIGEREDAGELSEEQAMQHPRRNEVFRDVGSAEHAPDDPNFIEISQSPFPPGATLLLCSDGVTDLVPASTLQKLLTQHTGAPQQAAQALVDATNAAGGKDNATALVVENASGPHTAGKAVQPRNKALAILPWVLAGAMLGGVGLWGWQQFAAKRTVAQQGPAGQTVHVWTVGSSQQADFPTITSALEKAQRGDTVLVGPGIYREQLVLRDGVTLRSEPRRAAVLSPLEGVAVTVDGARGAVLQGFLIQSTNESPFLIGILARSGQVSIEDVGVYGAIEAGVDVKQTAHISLLGSTIAYNPGTGIRVQMQGGIGLDSITITGNAIHDNGDVPGRPRPGVLLEGVPPLKMLFVRNNVIVRNAGPAIQAPRGTDLTDLERFNILSLPRNSLFGTPPPPPPRN